MVHAHGHDVVGGTATERVRAALDEAEQSVASLTQEVLDARA